MQSCKQNIPKTTIEKEIYNTFEHFKNENNIKIADFLNKLELGLFKTSYYRINQFYIKFLRSIYIYDLKNRELKDFLFKEKFRKFNFFSRFNQES
jgi:hypothetical protein